VELTDDVTFHGRPGADAPVTGDIGLFVDIGTEAYVSNLHLEPRSSR
jgi:hypothetical protein